MGSKPTAGSFLSDRPDSSDLSDLSDESDQCYAFGMIPWQTMAFLGGSIGSGELLLILAVALVILGPHKLPGIARTLGRWMNELRRSAREFSDELTRATLDNTPKAQPPENKSSVKETDNSQNLPK